VPDVIDAIQDDHRRIETLFDRLVDSNEQNPDTARELVHLLVAHETAEQELIHPLTRRAAEGVAEAVLTEEATAEKALSELEDLEVDSPQFRAKLVALRDDVLSHAEHEEREEHPQLRDNQDAALLERLASAYDIAKTTAPTHPHPTSPQSATGNLVLGPVVAMADRVRDAVRGAMPGEG
jgi:Hemerythrin HHE cation binding domain